MSTSDLRSAPNDPLKIELRVGNSLTLAITAVALVWLVVLVAMGL